MQLAGSQHAAAPRNSYLMLPAFSHNLRPNNKIQNFEFLEEVERNWIAPQKRVRRVVVTLMIKSSDNPQRNIESLAEIPLILSLLERSLLAIQL
jgi:hypothetical protein